MCQALSINKPIPSSPQRTGEPHLASEGYVGLDVHRTARIMSAGHGGQVLLSRTTSDLVEYALPEGVSLLDLEAHRLKDLQQPGTLFQLVIEGLAADFPPLKTLDSYPNNLPIQPTPFIGREKEVDVVKQQLLREDVHLVTLTGPGGVGKTRMALQVAAESSEHFADGTWFVSLAPITDPNLVIPAIIQTLGLQEVRDQSPLEHLKGSLHEKQMLLLLDNFEQVVSAAIQVADLLTVCRQLNVLVTSREVGDKEAVAWLLINVAHAVSTQGDFRRGHALFEESLMMFRELGNKRGIAYSLHTSALWLLLAMGDQAIVRARLEESLAISRELGDKNGMAFYFWISGWVALSQRNSASAQTLVEQSLTLWQEMGDRWRALYALSLLGRIKVFQGDFSAARTLHEESMTRARALDDSWITAFCLEGWAIVVAAQRERALAVRLWGAAESLRERCGIPLPPLERVDYEPAVAAARTQLGAQAFEAAWTEGRSMTLDQVLAALDAAQAERQGKSLRCRSRCSIA